MHQIYTIEEFKKKINNGKQIVIYGAGAMGRVIYRFLDRTNISVLLFAVTKQEKSTKIEGCPVCSLDEVLDTYKLKNINIILAVTKIHRDSMKQELRKRKIDSYYIFSDAFFYEVEREALRLEAKQEEKNKRKNVPGVTIGYLVPGYWNTDYAEKRLIINKIEEAIYVAMPKETSHISYLGTEYEEDLERYRQLSEACYAPEEYVPEVDLIHTFNMVCNTNRLWCASFETCMPRVWPKTELEKEYFLQLVEYMKQDNCRTLYAFCKNAYEIQKLHLAQYLSLDDVNLLMNKTKILHPPQKILITDEEFAKKHKKKELCFIFIGRNFFIKGGKEIIQALSHFENQYKFKLILISELLFSDYFTKTTYEEMVKWKKIIQEKAWVEYYGSLPNKKVLEKCKDAIIGLFPSVADTYGYAVLEMQASGCPVITTNIRALSEINNEECGWICHLPLDQLGCCAEQNAQIRSQILEQELESCLKVIFEHPEMIQKKGRAALEKIRKMHDPKKYQMELRSNLLLISEE